jgi:hypothetical protein
MEILAPHLDHLVLVQDLKTRSKLNELKGSVSKSPTIKTVGLNSVFFKIFLLKLNFFFFGREKT